jgi:hypothetical protein
VTSAAPTREQLEVLRYVGGTDGWVPLLRLILAEYRMLDVSSCVPRGWLEYAEGSPGDGAVCLTDLGRAVLAEWAV